jgi:hypothetical protein
MGQQWHTVNFSLSGDGIGSECVKKKVNNNVTTIYLYTVARFLALMNRVRHE